MLKDFIHGAWSLSVHFEIDGTATKGNEGKGSSSYQKTVTNLVGAPKTQLLRISNGLIVSDFTVSEQFERWFVCEILYSSIVVDYTRNYIIVAV